MPFAPVVLTWQGTTRTQSANQGDGGVRVYSVVGATDPDAALSQFTTATSIVVNTPWSSTDPNNVLRAQSIVPNFQGPILSQVVVSYAVPPRGYFQATVKPTDQPWVWEWGACLDSAQMDRDIDNNPILNAAFDPPAEPFQTSVEKQTLRVIRFEAFYDRATLRYYDGAVNSDDLNLTQPNGKTVAYPAGTIRVVRIVPAQAYTTFDTFVPVGVELELYDLSLINPNLHDPFQLHVLNVGSNAYYGDGTKKGHLLYASNREPVDKDVPLDGDGVPIDTTLLVAGDGNDPVAPVAAPDGPPDGATVESIGTGASQVTFLVYNRFRKVPLLPLLTPGGLSSGGS